MADTYPKNSIDDNGVKKVWDMVMDRLGLKVDKEAGKGLSTNDYTTTEKNKLAGIEDGAEVNTVTSVAGKTGAVTLDKSDVGLSNVGNFKAVSTSANQGLTDTEKSNARANIDTPSNGDIQSSTTPPKASVVTVTDAAPMNAEDITVDITPVQDLHGFDKPWAGGAGKNKLPLVLADIKSLNTTGTWSGNTYTKNGVSFICEANQDGYLTKVTANGQATAEVALRLLQQSIDFSSGSIASGIAGGSSSTYLLEFVPSSYSGRTYVTNGSVALNNTNVFIIEFTIRSGIAVNNVVAQPMIRLASETDATFAPYSNICPIEGWTSETVDRVGKNWFDKNANNTSKGYKDNTYLYYNNSEGIADGWYISEYIRVQSGVSITLSGARGNDPALCFYDKYKNYISGVAYGSAMPKTFNVPSNCAYIRLSVPKNLKDTAQLELDSTPTTYEPYQGISRTVNFGETVYGGKWHSKGGTDKTYGYVEFDGSEDEVWSLSGGGYRVTNSSIRDLVKRPSSGSATDIYLISNSFIQRSAIDLYVGNVDGIGIEYDTGLFCVHYGSYRVPMTVADWRAYLAQHPLQVCYELATPTTINTRAVDIPMLQGINTISTSTGDVTLKYQPDNVIGELKGRDEAIWDAFKVNDWSGIYSAVSSSTYQFVFNLYRRGGLVGISSFNFGSWLTCPVGSGEETLQIPIASKYIPKNKAYFKFRHVSGNGSVVITLQTDGYVKFSWNITIAMTGDEASAGWLLEWNDVQLAKDLFNN